MILTKDQQEKLIEKEEKFVEELQKYKNVSGKIYFDLKTNYSERISCYFSGGYLWFEIPGRRLTTLCNCLEQNKDWYYVKKYGIPNSYTSGELDILANKESILHKLEETKEDQNSLLDKILG